MVKARTNVVSSFLMLGTVCAFSVVNAGAEITHHHEEHVHGVATLNWILEAEKLHIELRSPAMNLLMFEHSPKTQEEIERLTSVINKLENIDQVITLKGGECELSSTNIHNPYDEQGTESNELAHSEISADYVFVCQSPAQFEMMNIELFNTFTGFELINSQWIVDGMQGSAELDHDHHQINLNK